MIRLIILFFLLLSSVYCFSESKTDSVFNERTFRYDFEFTCNPDSYFVVHKQSKILQYSYSGTMINKKDLGNFRYRVQDIISTDMLFVKGFCSLFGEWLSTAASANENASFYHALFFPEPKSDFILHIDKRDSLNNWINIYSDSVSLNDLSIITEKPDVYDVDTIKFSGKSSEIINLLILAEGYTKNEMGKFSKDARRMTDSLFSSKPFDELSDHFNVYAIKIPSVETGSDIPQRKIFKNTAFNSSYNTFGTERYLTTLDLKSVYDCLDAIDWNHIILLVNTDLYGGGGIYNNYSITSVDDPRSAFVFIHEFGHSFAGLADEYYTSEVAYRDLYPEGLEPWELNITSLIDFKSKWADMIYNSTPVPTPRDPVFSNKVGVFEGGGYVSKGIFSPFQSCWMKESKAKGFCPVCVEIIRKTILE